MAEAKTNRSEAAEPRSVALDGYRALAIMIVMLAHCRFAPGYPDWLKPAHAFFKGGVTAFMVLSGYLITQALLREEARYGTIRLLPFWGRQAVRFYLPLLAYLAVAVTWFHGRPDFEWWRTLRVLWLDPNTGEGSHWSMHLYSLAAQLQFCLWWPLLLRVIPKERRGLAITTLVVLAVAWRAVGREIAIFWEGNYLRTDFVFGSLLVGSWWALKAASGRLDWMLRLRGLQLLPLVVAAVGVILFTRSPSAFLGLFSNDLRALVAPWREVFEVTVMIRIFVALAAMMAFGCLAFLLHRGRPARLAQVFGSPWVTWLGRISFSVYLWQNVFCFGITGTFADRFPYNLLASVAFGWLAYRLVELPSLSLRRKVKEATEPPRSAAAAPVASGQS